MSGLAEALARNRGSERCVEFGFPLATFMDDTVCQTISDDLAAAGGDGWVELKATREAHVQIPDTPGLYAFVWQPELNFRVHRGPETQDTSIKLIVYVGKAGGDGGNGTLKQRYKQEYSQHVASDADLAFGLPAGGSREQRLQRLLNLHPLKYWYLSITEWERINALESRLIDILNPPINQDGRKKKAFT